MLSPELLRRLGVRNPEEISKEMQAAMQQKTMMEQGVAGRGEPMQFETMSPPNQTIGKDPQKFNRKSAVWPAECAALKKCFKNNERIG